MLHGSITDTILRTFYRVHTDLGHGFLESVYESAMVLSLRRAGLAVDRQRSIPVIYAGSLLGDFRPDLIVENLVIVEVKAGRTVAKVHEAQLLNYLRASELEVGLLLNFGPHASFRRLVYGNERKTQAGRCRPATSDAAGQA